MPHVRRTEHSVPDSLRPETDDTDTTDSDLYPVLETSERIGLRKTRSKTRSTRSAVRGVGRAVGSS
eukprot:1118062-Prymnesium_polylepis.2